MNAFLGTRIKIDLTDYAENLPEAKKMIYTAYNTLGSLYRKNHPPWVKYDKMFKRSKVNHYFGRLKIRIHRETGNQRVIKKMASTMTQMPR